MHIALAGVFMHRIVRNVPHAAMLIALRIEIFVVKSYLREKRIARQGSYAPPSQYGATLGSIGC